MYKRQLLQIIYFDTVEVNERVEETNTHPHNISLCSCVDSLVEPTVSFPKDLYDHIYLMEIFYMQIHITVKKRDTSYIY